MSDDNIIQFPGADDGGAEAQSANILGFILEDSQRVISEEEREFRGKAREIAAEITAFAEGEPSFAFLLLKYIGEELERAELTAKADRILGPRGGTGPQVA
jgi:hypothetical protein